MAEEWGDESGHLQVGRSCGAEAVDRRLEGGYGRRRYGHWREGILHVGSVADRLDDVEDRMMAFSVVDGLHVEEVDDGFLVLVPDRTEVVHLRGPEADAFGLARDRVDVVPPVLERPMAGLIELGIARSDTWSRRRAIQLGGAAAAAAVAVIALPGVAAADSPPTTAPPTPPGSIDVNLQTWVPGWGPVPLPVDVPIDGPGTAYLYASPDRTTPPVGSVPVTLPAGQTIISYTFAGIAPGTYYVDIQQPFQAVGAAGATYAGTTYYIDWNYAYSTPSDPPKLDEYQQVTVTSGATVDLDETVAVVIGQTPLI